MTGFVACILVAVTFVNTAAIDWEDFQYPGTSWRTYFHFGMVVLCFTVGAIFTILPDLRSHL